MTIRKLLLFLCVLLTCTHLAKAQKTKVEAVKKICEDLPFSQKPIVAVAPFKIAVANSNAGGGLSDMLMNALLNSGCYRVVERERLNVIMEEQGLGLSGAGDESSFASVGKQIGAQLIVMGSITEFTENESGGGVAGAVGGMLFRRTTGVGGVGMRKAHIGFTIRLVNPSTGEVVAMQSFDKKRNSVGVAVAGAGDGALAGGSFYQSKAMQDAIEEALIDAVGFISQKKSDFMSAIETTKSTTIDLKSLKESCPTLKLARKPRVMVIIPEEHLAGAGSNYDPNRRTVTVNVNTNGTNGGNNNSSSNNDNQLGGTTQPEQDINKNAGTDAINTVRNMFRPPDPAGETEIIKKFLEFGYEVVDSKQYEKLRADKQFLSAFGNPKIASQLASKFGADIIIVGEAFSEYSKSGNGMSSCRARVEAKAIMVSTASILAADGLHGSGLDVSEVIAGKTALKNAGAKIAEYFLSQLCEKSSDIAANIGAGSKVAAASGSGKNLHTTEIKIANIDYAKVMAIGKVFGTIKDIQSAERVSFADKIAVFSVKHFTTTDKLIERLVANPALKLNVTEVNGDNVSIVSK